KSVDMVPSSWMNQLKPKVSQFSLIAVASPQHLWDVIAVLGFAYLSNKLSTGAWYSCSIQSAPYHVGRMT
ncbi:hypothetical protein CRM22_006845, partial [Opisthorchis felineus]